MKHRVTTVKTRLTDIGSGEMVLTFGGKCERDGCENQTLCTQTIRGEKVIVEYKPRFCEMHGIHGRFGINR